jgi:hypothetical protein
MNPIQGSKNTEVFVPEECDSNLIKLLPPEIIRLIFISTDSRSLANINKVSTRWYTLSCDDFLWNETILAELILKCYRERVFTPSDWGVEGRFPRNLCHELDKESPYYEGKTVGETSLMAFKNPQIQNCHELEAWAKKNGVEELYKAHEKKISNLEREHSLSYADWILIPDGGVIPNSRRKSLGTLEAELKKKDKSYKPGSLFDLSLIHLTGIKQGHNALFTPSCVFSRCLSTNKANAESINVYGNHEKKLVAMIFYRNSLVPNTGIIPIKELPYTFLDKTKECLQIKESSRQIEGNSHVIS